MQREGTERTELMMVDGARPPIVGHVAAIAELPAERRGG